MRRLIAAAMVTVSISAFAARERFGALQVADLTTVKEASVKIGQMFGSPIVAASVDSALADFPMLEYFGPMRPKSAMLFSLYADSVELQKSPEKALEDLKFSMLYPVSITKTDFIKKHEGVYETNGVLVVKGDMGGSGLDEDKTYVAFSKDGKWASASDSIAYCNLALKDIAFAEKPMGSEIVRLTADPPALKALSGFLSKQKEITPDVIEFANSFKSAVVGLGVSDLGIDMVSCSKINEGSKFAKAGLKPLAAAPFSFAGNSAICASAQAEDPFMAFSGDITDKQWLSLLAVCKKHGIDVARFLSRTCAGGKSMYTYDFGALFKFVQENIEKFGEIKGDKLVDDIAAIFKDDKLDATGKASFSAVSVKGFTPQWPVSERFTATLPEVAGRKPFCAGFFTLSSLLKALVPQLLALAPEEERKEMKPLLEALAVEQKRGLASAYWREGDAIKTLTRISADEIRGLGMAFNGIMSMGIMDAFGGDGEEKEKAPVTTPAAVPATAAPAPAAPAASEKK